MADRGLKLSPPKTHNGATLLVDSECAKELITQPSLHLRHVAYRRRGVTYRACAGNEIRGDQLVSGTSRTTRPNIESY